MEKKEKIKPKSIKINYLYNLLYEVVALITPLITTPYISRVLGAEGVGIYSYTHSIAQYFIIFGNLGIATYGQMKVAGCRDNKQEYSNLFFELLIIRATALFLSTTVYIVVVGYSEEYIVSRLIWSLLIVGNISDLSWFYRGVEEFSKIVKRNLVVKFLVIFMIFAFVKTKDDINIYILLVVLATVLANITFLFHLPSYLCKPSYINIVQHVKPCFVYFVPTIATSVYTLLDKTMIGAITKDASQNGYYEQAHRIEQILMTVITSLNIIMRSRMTYLYQRKMFSEMRDKMERSIKFILFLSIPMTVGIICIASIFIPVFLGAGYEECIFLLQIFSLLFILIGLSNCINTHFLGPSGRQGKSNYVLIVGAVANVMCNYIVIPRWGAVGAAMASVLAEMLILAGYLWLAHDFFSPFKIVRFGWKNIIASAIMYCAILPMKSIQMSMIAILLMQFIVGAAIYVVVLVALRDKFVKTLFGDAKGYVVKRMHDNKEKHIR